MGIISSEKNFPRGGKKPAVAVPRTGHFRLFGKSSQKRSHSENALKKSSKKHGSSTELKVTHAEPLTLKTLSEGMLVLGCVCEIQEYHIVVSLPGRLIGHVPVTNISSPYTKCLKKLVDGASIEEKIPELDEIFHVGQAVVTRVVEISHLSEHNRKVILSVVPDVVQSDWSPRSMTAGCVVVAAVKSREENGYIMDTGINNVRAFLKKSAALQYETVWNQGRRLGIGHLMRCLVTKSNVTPFAATVELSADPYQVAKAVADLDELSLDILLPGTLLNSSVSKVFKNGLQVKFGSHFVGYIHKDHLSASWDTPQDYSIGDDHHARVLYVLPTVKFVYLSLKKELCDPEANSMPSASLKIGSIVKKAKIEHVDSCGITVRIKTGAAKLKGFVSINHCSITGSERDTSKSLKEELTERWAVGTCHKCKVLGYDYMSQVFICTLDKRIMKAQFVHPSDLQPGMFVSCQIKEHVQNGAFVVISGGSKSLTGFVRSLHLGNVPLQHPEKKFPVGSRHSARVLLVQGNKVQLTLKPLLLASDTPPLCRFEDAHPGMLCEGVVALIVKTGLLLTFYSDVKGWLELNRAVGKDEYYIGQVVPVYIETADVSNGKLTLSLKQLRTTDEKTSKKRKTRSRVGKMYELSVTNCTDDTLEVESNAGSGILPAQHLTDSPTLAQLLLSTYRPGDVIDGAFCFSDADGLVFTLRPSLIEYFKSRGSAKLSGVREQMLLPCAVRSVMPKQVTIQLPLSKCNIADVKLKNLITEQQSVVCKRDLYCGFLHHGTLHSGKRLADFWRNIGCLQVNPFAFECSCAVGLCNASVEDATQLRLVEHQGLICRVVKLGGPSKCPCVTTKLSDCWDYSTEACVSLLCSFWKDYDTIVEHMKEQGNPLASIVPGDRVKGEVIAVEDCGVVLKLENGVQGIATSELCKGSLECGAEVVGTVLFIDLQNNCVELTLNPGIMERINTVQDGKLDGDLGVGTGVRGEVLTVRQEMIVVVLKGAGRKQLAYIPSQCHMNDLMLDLKRYRIGETSKMVVQALEAGRIICVQQRFLFQLIKRTARVTFAPEQTKSNVCVTADKGTCDLNNIDSGVQGLEASEHEGNKEVLPRVKRRKARYDSAEDTENECHIISSGGASGSEPEIEARAGEDSSDEDETTFLRKLEAKAMENYVNSVSTEVLEMSCDSDTDVTDENTRRNKKRKVCANGIVKDVSVEGSHKKRMKAAVQNEVIKEPKGVDRGQAMRLSLTAGFVWDANPSLLPAAAAPHKSDSSSDEEEVEKKERKQKKMTQAERREQARQEEERLRAAEQKLIDSETGPQSADDFDRLVLSSPNSSLCWIKYMAFHLQATEIEKARAVAQRALSTISFREEQEKLNVWCALLNLENLYGTQESLDKVLEEAVRMNDPFKVYTQMLQIYADSGKVEDAEKLVSLLTKKFCDNKEAWLKGGEVLLKLGKLEKSRSLMQRSLASLDKKLHVEVISKFAHLENRLGEPERAQTLMEHILTSYPKRVDVWSSYVDMLVKNGQLESARQVLERGVAQKLPARKMKSLFAKFLQFEEHHGTPEGVEQVRQMALRYVEAVADQVDDDD